MDKETAFKRVYSYRSGETGYEEIISLALQLPAPISHTLSQKTIKQEVMLCGLQDSVLSSKHLDVFHVHILVVANFYCHFYKRLTDSLTLGVWQIYHVIH